QRSRFRSTMRFLRPFFGGQQIGRAEERPKADPVPGKLIDSALLAIDDADGGPALQAGFAKCSDRSERRSTRRYDVLDEANPLAGLEHPFEPVTGPVALRFLPYDQKRQARRQRGRRDESDSSQLGAGEPGRLGGGLGDTVGNARADRLQQVRPRLEAVLVQVVGGATTRAKHEVPLEIRVLPDRVTKLVGGHWH